jgi:transcriptional regulator with PAS, ATPase and Fis domain
MFLKMVGVDREDLIGHSVYEFRDKGKYDTCVSDIVLSEKNNVSVLGNIAINTNGIVKNERLMINATPIFDQSDNIEYIYVECELVRDINSRYRESSARNFSFEYATINTSLSKTENIDINTSIIANSPQMKKILATAKNIASVDTTVLISGASGTGKELIAEYIHSNSSRKKNPMIVINCASIPENLLESTLFGYEKGSFSGGLATGKKGLFEEANNGTLFLDEINSLPYALQGKILRALETKKIQRIGNSKEIPIDFRLITATNENLNQKVLNGTFRSDLYYRINVLPIILPTLAERREDIIPLAQYFNDIFCDKYRRIRIFDSNALNHMVKHDWPGNIRELRNAVERAVVMTEHEYIESTDIDLIINSQKKGVTSTQPQQHIQNTDYYKSLLDDNVPLQEFLDDCEKKYISEAIHRYGSTYKVASALKTNQSVIMRRKCKYNL